MVDGTRFVGRRESAREGAQGVYETEDGTEHEEFDRGVVQPRRYLDEIENKNGALGGGGKGGEAKSEVKKETPSARKPPPASAKKPNESSAMKRNLK